MQTSERGDQVQKTRVCIQLGDGGSERESRDKHGNFTSKEGEKGKEGRKVLSFRLILRGCRVYGGKNMSRWFLGESSGW